MNVQEENDVDSSLIKKIGGIEDKLKNVIYKML